MPVDALFPVLWAFVACCLVILQLARLALWLGHGQGHGATGMALAFGQGARFDLVVGAFAAWLLGLLAWPLRWAGRSRIAAGWLRLAGGGLLALITLAGVGEYFYFGFYKTRFDPIVFGLLEDDTAAVLETIWKGYPVLWMLALLALVAIAGTWLWQWLARGLARRWPRSRAPAARIGMALVQVALLGLLARGGVGTFPLLHRDVAYSADPFVNTLVINAPVALYKAARLRSKEIDIGDDPSVGLRRLGFAGPREAAEAAGLGSDLSEAAIVERLFPTASGTPRPLSASPHVVLALLESFGADLLSVDGPGNDLLGRLRAQLPKGYRFGNFIAGENGTHPELEYLLLGSPITPLTRGRNADIAFPSSAAWPFRAAGYRTAFVYAGGADWRNIGRAFAHHGFEQVYDRSNIHQRFPEATGTEWGLYDEYVFAFVRHLLRQADRRGERLFVFVLTTTNHPPYRLDVPHRSWPLDPAALGPRTGQLPKGELRRLLATYQYQADQFGAFLQDLDAEGLGLHTVVAAAGDHNLREHFRYVLPAEQPEVDRVFGFLRLPPALRAGRVPDLDAIAGHADLVPTLVHLALPGRRYFASGRDLLAPAPEGGAAFSHGERLYLRDGVLFPLERASLHRWRDARRIVTRGEPLPPALQARVRRQLAMRGLRDWYIRRVVIAARQRGRSRQIRAGFSPPRSARVDRSDANRKTCMAKSNPGPQLLASHVLFGC